MQGKQASRHLICQHFTVQVDAGSCTTGGTVLLGRNVNCPSETKARLVRGGYLEPEGNASQQGVHSDMDTLLQGGIQADVGPVALPTQDRGSDKLEAIGTAGFQLAAGQHLAPLLTVGADCMLAGVTCQWNSKSRFCILQQVKAYSWPVQNISHGSIDSPDAQAFDKP